MSKTYVKNKQIILELQNIKLVAKDFQVQPFHTYIYNDKSDILHLYYTLDLYKKDYKGKWHSVTSSCITEFGVMAYLSDAIQELLDIDVKSKGISRPMEDAEDFDGLFPVYVQGMLNEDCFHFVKHRRIFEDCRGQNDFEWYDLHIMIGGNELGNVPTGCYLSNLTRDDILVLKEFGDLFISEIDKQTKHEIKMMLVNEEDEEYNYPKIFREHLKEKYNVDDWQDAFIKLSIEEYIFDEYLDFITGKKDISELKCHEWHGKQRTMPELLKEMRDYEAYLHIYEDNVHFMKT